MAKKLDLRTWLVESKLFFIPRGIHHLVEFNTYIQKSVPHLCDDKVLCEHSGTTNGRPEWQHEVRWALHELQDKGITQNIKKGAKGYWKLK